MIMVRLTKKEGGYRMLSKQNLIWFVKLLYNNGIAFTSMIIGAVQKMYRNY